MQMIPAVLICENELGIPVYGTSEYCYIEWTEGESIEDVLKKCDETSGEKFLYPWSRFQVWTSDIKDEEDWDAEINGWNVQVYEVICFRSKLKYFLIAYMEIMELDDALHSVCVPFNRLNFLKFYVEYLCPIGQTRFRIW